LGAGDSFNVAPSTPVQAAPEAEILSREGYHVWPNSVASDCSFQPARRSLPASETFGGIAARDVERKAKHHDAPYRALPFSSGPSRRSSYPHRGGRRSIANAG
jgi:hypothetical protein